MIDNVQDVCYFNALICLFIFCLYVYVYGFETRFVAVNEEEAILNSTANDV
jgi:hypothetical protein